VDVEPVDALSARRDARVLHELAVARVVRDLLLLRRADRVRARGRDAESVLLGRLRGAAAKLDERFDGLRNRARDRRRQLHDGREELRLHLAGETERPRVADDCVDGGLEEERLGVEDHHLLLDPDRERGAFRPGGVAHGLYVNQTPRPR
jgi:hypothetical protein